MIRPATLPIRTERLRLRDFVASDWPAVHAYSSDPDVVRFMFWGPRTQDESRGFVDRMLASQKQEPRTVWELAVERVGDGAVVGSCDLTLEDDEGDLGFVLAKHAWGQGVATDIDSPRTAGGALSSSPSTRSTRHDSNTEAAAPSRSRS